MFYVLASASWIWAHVACSNMENYWLSRYTILCTIQAFQGSVWFRCCIMMLEVGLRPGFVRLITLDVLPFIMIIYYFYTILLYDYIDSLPMNDVARRC